MLVMDIMPSAFSVCTPATDRGNAASELLLIVVFLRITYISSPKIMDQCRKSAELVSGQLWSKCAPVMAHEGLFSQPAILPYKLLIVISRAFQKGITRIDSFAISRIKKLLSACITPVLFITHSKNDFHRPRPPCYFWTVTYGAGA
jgi:hypothetical protein